MLLVVFETGIGGLMFLLTTDHSWKKFDGVVINMGRNQELERELCGLMYPDQTGEYNNAFVTKEDLNSIILQLPIPINEVVVCGFAL